jgi:hypothetical protein
MLSTASFGPILDLSVDCFSIECLVMSCFRTSYDNGIDRSMAWNKRLISHPKHGATALAQSPFSFVFSENAPLQECFLVLVDFSEKKAESWVVLSVVRCHYYEVGEAYYAVAVYVCVGVPVGIAGSGAVGICQDD